MQVEEVRNFGVDPDKVSVEGKRQISTNKIDNPEGLLKGLKPLSVSVVTRTGRGGGSSSVRTTYYQGWHNEIPGAKLVFGETGLETMVEQVTTG